MSDFDLDEKERLLEEFRACLERCDDEGTNEADDEENRVDLFTLLKEIAELKNEVRLESRQYKVMLEELRSFSDGLREQNQRLIQDLERAREQSAVIQRKTERDLFLDMLDLRDRLEAGVKASVSHQPHFIFRLFPNEMRFARSQGEGLTLILQRLDDQLASYRVRPFNAIGQSLDPYLMRVVGLESVQEKPDGQVLRESRRGFYHDGELLRAAEVIVNKRESKI